MSDGRLRKFPWSASWYIIWTAGQRSRRCSTGTSDKVEAERVLARFRSERARPPESFAVTNILDAKLAAIETRWAKNREYELRPLRPHFGGLPPSLINPALVRSYISKRQSAGKSNGTIDKELRMLRAALSWAAREGWRFDMPYIETPGGAAPRERWLTKEEARKLIEAAAAQHIRTFICLALYTGARTRRVWS